MSPRSSKNTYAISDYDKYVCLKWNSFMWLIMLFLMRPYLVLFLSVVNRKDKMGLINLFYEDRIPMILAAAAAIPATMVLYSWIRRTPDGSSKVRWIWKNGRVLLVVSALLNVLIIFLPVVFGAVFKVSMQDLVLLVISTSIFFYLYYSSRVIDVFADFPTHGANKT